MQRNEVKNLPHSRMSELAKYRMRSIDCIAYCQMVNCESSWPTAHKVKGKLSFFVTLCCLQEEVPKVVNVKVELSSAEGEAH